MWHVTSIGGSAITRLHVVQAVIQELNILLQWRCKAQRQPIRVQRRDLRRRLHLAGTSIVRASASRSLCAAQRQVSDTADVDSLNQGLSRRRTCITHKHLGQHPVDPNASTSPVSSNLSGMSKLQRRSFCRLNAVYCTDLRHEGGDEGRVVYNDRYLLEDVVPAQLGVLQLLRRQVGARLAVQLDALIPQLDRLHAEHRASQDPCESHPAGQSHATDHVQLSWVLPVRSMHNGTNQRAICPSASVFQSLPVSCACLCGITLLPDLMEQAPH